VLTGWWRPHQTASTSSARQDSTSSPGTRRQCDGRPRDFRYGAALPKVTDTVCDQAKAGVDSPDQVGERTRGGHVHSGCHIWGREGTRYWPLSSACPAWSSCQPTTRPLRTAPQPRLSGSRSRISVGAALSLMWGGRSSSRYPLQEVSGVRR